MRKKGQVACLSREVFKLQEMFKLREMFTPRHSDEICEIEWMKESQQCSKQNSCFSLNWQVSRRSVINLQPEQIFSNSGNFPEKDFGPLPPFQKCAKLTLSI